MGIIKLNKSKYGLVKPTLYVEGVNVTSKNFGVNSITYKEIETMVARIANLRPEEVSVSDVVDLKETIEEESYNLVKGGEVELCIDSNSLTITIVKKEKCIQAISNRLETEDGEYIAGYLNTVLLNAIKNIDKSKTPRPPYSTLNTSQIDLVKNANLHEFGLTLLNTNGFVESLTNEIIKVNNGDLRQAVEDVIIYERTFEGTLGGVPVYFGGY